MPARKRVRKVRPDQQGGNIFKKAWKGIKKGAKVVNKGLKKTKIISRGLKVYGGLTGNKFVSKGGDAAAKLGYGKRRAPARKRKASVPKGMKF